MRARRERERNPERGYLMAGLIAAVAIMLIFSTVAFQAWEDVLRRDNEAEMIFRAQDLVRGIQRYRTDHGGMGPMKLEDLLEPGPVGQYYLRQMWKDPLVRDGKWGLIFIGPGGALLDPHAPPTEGEEGGLQMQPFGSKRKDPATGRGGSGGPGQEASVLGGGIQPLSQQNQAGSGEAGGLPIAGVKSLCTEEPFRVYRGLTEYSQWLFTYLDLEQAQLPGQGQPGAGATQPPQPQPQPPGFGQRPGSHRRGPMRPPRPTPPPRGRKGGSGSAG